MKQFRCALHEGEPGNLVKLLICNLCLGVIQIVRSSEEGGGGVPKTNNPYLT